MSAPTNTNTQNKSPSVSLGTKLKGGVQVAKGLGDTVRGTAFGAVDSVEKRDSSINDEIARRGRAEIEEGIAMIKGRPVNTTAAPGAHNSTTANNNGPGESLQGWGSGINGGNANATTNATGFPAPHGQEYAQNSTTAKTDLGRGPNAYSGSNTQPLPEYPTPGGPPPQDFKSGMGQTHPTHVGNRPMTDTPVGEQGYQQRQDADQPMR